MKFKKVNKILKEAYKSFEEITNDISLVEDDFEYKYTPELKYRKAFYADEDIAQTLKTHIENKLRVLFNLYNANDFDVFIDNDFTIYVSTFREDIYNMVFDNLDSWVQTFFEAQDIFLDEELILKEDDNDDKKIAIDRIISSIQPKHVYAVTIPISKNNMRLINKIRKVFSTSEYTLRGRYLIIFVESKELYNFLYDFYDELEKSALVKAKVNDNDTIILGEALKNPSRNIKLNEAEEEEEIEETVEGSIIENYKGFNIIKVVYSVIIDNKKVGDITSFILKKDNYLVEPGVTFYTIEEAKEYIDVATKGEDEASDKVEQDVVEERFDLRPKNKEILKEAEDLNKDTKEDGERSNEPILASNNELEQTPTLGANMGTAGLINKAIIDEWEAIDFYNSIIATLGGEEVNTQMIKVIQDIIAEENVHVGQLEGLLKTISPNVENIEDGKEEVKDQLEDEESTTKIKELIKQLEEK